MVYKFHWVVMETGSLFFILSLCLRVFHLESKMVVIYNA